MGKHRKESGHPPKAGLPLRNKMVAMVVAGGAFAAVGQPLVANAGADQQRDVQPLAGEKKLKAAVSGTWNSPASVRLLSNQQPIEQQTEAAKAVKSQQIEAERIARAEAERKRAEAERKKAEEAARKAAEEAWKRENGFVKPTEGTFTSGFGSRWGTSHDGIDIANSVGTPIYSVAAGEVIDAGSASGFGLWVRVQHDDGTITIYGHVNSTLVSEGEHVGAGDQIATMGNRGQSTGPHLHFGVEQGGDYVNPVSWLSSRGIDIN